MTEDQFNTSRQLHIRLISAPLCNRQAEHLHPDWYRIRNKIWRKRWEEVRSRNQYFDDYRLSLGRRPCSCGKRKCQEYIADNICIAPSLQLVFQPDPLFKDYEEPFEYYWDGEELEIIPNYRPFKFFGS